jgi:hypothetical protein
MKFIQCIIVLTCHLFFMVNIVILQSYNWTNKTFKYWILVIKLIYWIVILSWFACLIMLLIMQLWWKLAINILTMHLWLNHKKFTVLVCKLCYNYVLKLLTYSNPPNDLLLLLLYKWWLDKSLRWIQMQYLWWKPHASQLVVIKFITSIFNMKLNNHKIYAYIIN